MLTEFLDRLFNRGSTNSRTAVKQRLQLLLAHDRSDLTPQTLEAIRKEILQVISKYVEIDDDGLEFVLESDQRLSALVANFPIRRIRSEEEQRAPVLTTLAPIELDDEHLEGAEIFQLESEENAPASAPAPAAHPPESPLEAEPPQVEDSDAQGRLPAHMTLEPTLDSGPDLGTSPAAD